MFNDFDACDPNEFEDDFEMFNQNEADDYRNDLSDYEDWISDDIDEDYDYDAGEDE